MIKEKIEIFNRTYDEIISLIEKKEYSKPNITFHYESNHFTIFLKGKTELCLDWYTKRKYSGHYSTITYSNGVLIQKSDLSTKELKKWDYLFKTINDTILPIELRNLVENTKVE